jgi:hypothetical protein
MTAKRTGGFLLISTARWFFWIAASTLLPSAWAGALSFTGDLRTDANFTACGFGCTLGPANTDGDYAQWAAVSVPFTVPVDSLVTAITFS